MVLALLAGLVGFIVYGCGDSGGGSSTGTLNLSITDAPVDDAAGFYVTFTSFRLQGIDGSADQGPFDIPVPYRLIDLMEYTGAASATLVTGLELPAGVYKVRLDADLSFDEVAQASWIEFDADAPECVDRPAGTVWVEGTERDSCRYPVEIPSEEQSWFKPKGYVTVVAGGSSSFTIEFDLRKNVVNPSNPGNIAYKLKPTGLRLVDNAEVGMIAGEIEPVFLGEQCSGLPAFIYLYNREGAAGPFVPDDMHPANTSYVTSVSVMAEPLEGDPVSYHYLIGFVPAGTYGVAMLCDVDDDPDADEDLIFVAWADDVEVVTDAVTTQDLPVPAP
jgi:hypothetical protein